MEEPEALLKSYRQSLGLINEPIDIFPSWRAPTEAPRLMELLAIGSKFICIKGPLAYTWVLAPDKPVTMEDHQAQRTFGIGTEASRLKEPWALAWFTYMAQHQ